MTLKHTITTMRELLQHITQDLHKAEGGNKAASQRVRTGTVKLEKVAKLFRKESIKNDKQTKGRKKAAPARKPTAKAAKSSHKPAAKHKKASSRAHAMSFRRRQTAKLPSRRKTAR
jgi:DNA-binding protein H-NS